MLSFKHVQNSLSDSPNYNVRQNILAGPGARQYWNHSPNLEQALVPEEGPQPLQGNIGAVLSNDPKYILCQNDLPSVGGSPNCTSAFVPDIYTVENSCGAQCDLRYPESYGEKSFGFPDDMSWKDKISNAHQVHAYKNLRAAAEGQGPGSQGPIEWIPAVGIDESTNTAVMYPNPAYQMVGNWSNLKQYQNLKYANFRKN